jgi:endonuclease/exonuclease/phosphatase family metal-dependent hydrolase
MIIYRLKLIVILGVLTGMISTAFSQSERQKLKLNVMSFNVRYNTPKDSINAWPYRKEKVAGVITSNNIDIVGVQEAWIDQIRDLRKLLPGYAWFGWSRDNGKRKGEFVPVFYKKDKFTVLEKGIFWFSETPEVAGSKGWDVKYPRIVVWARFKDKLEGKEFYFFNTHLGGEIARYESAKLLRSKIDQMTQGLGVIVTGDFNATPDSGPIDVMISDDYKVYLADALLVAKEKNDELFTNYLFDGNDKDLKRIDYIFVSQAMNVLYHEIINKRVGRYYPSDHLAVKVMLEY